MNVREALEKTLGRIRWCEEDQQLISRDLAPIIETAARAAWNKGLADQHRFPVSSDNGVTAFVAAMMEKP